MLHILISIPVIPFSQVVYESNKVSSFVVHKYLFLLVPKLYCIYY